MRWTRSFAHPSSVENLASRSYLAICSRVRTTDANGTSGTDGDDDNVQCSQYRQLASETQNKDASQKQWEDISFDLLEEDDFDMQEEGEFVLLGEDDQTLTGRELRNN